MAPTPDPTTMLTFILLSTFIGLIIIGYQAGRLVEAVCKSRKHS